MTTPKAWVRHAMRAMDTAKASPESARQTTYVLQPDPYVTYAARAVACHPFDCPAAPDPWHDETAFEAFVVDWQPHTKETHRG